MSTALDKISEDWDLEMLSGLLVDLEASGFDLRLTGFGSCYGWKRGARHRRPPDRSHDTAGKGVVSSSAGSWM